jgi:uncharacterized phage-associated protein
MGALRERKRAPLHDMTPQLDRIVAAIAFLINEGREQEAVTQYDIVKSLFLADRAHLNKYGRPITFDNYWAMKDGPVPNTSYNFLNEDQPTLGGLERELPWSRNAAPNISPRAFAFTIPENDVDTSPLSESDIEELRAALTTVKSLGFNQVRRLTREDQAYVEAWIDDGNAQRYPMSYSLLFDTPNEQMASELAFLSQHL